jgi:hypothetical protein
MSVYTVHEPPNRSAEPLPAAERIVFVRDGFSFWAFVLGPLWMLGHRMWINLAGFIVAVGAIEAALVVLGASRTSVAFVSLFIALLVGLEAGTLRRLALRQRGWNNVGVVSGDDVEDAERRFFEAWLRQTPPRRPGPPPLPPVAAMPRAAATSDVIGLFPEPGVRR